MLYKTVYFWLILALIMPAQAYVPSNSPKNPSKAKFLAPNSFLVNDSQDKSQINQWQDEVKGVIEQLKDASEGSLKDKNAFEDGIIFRIRGDINSMLYTFANESNLSEGYQIVRQYINIWKKEEENLTPRLMKKINALEIFLFERNLIEEIVEELIDFSSEDPSDGGYGFSDKSISMFSLGVSMSFLNKTSYNLADLFRSQQMQFFGELFEGERLLLSNNKLIIFNLEEEWLNRLKEFDNLTPLEYINFRGFEAFYKIYNSLDKAVKDRLPEAFDDSDFIVRATKYRLPMRDRLLNTVQQSAELSLISQKEASTWSELISDHEVFDPQSKNFDLSGFTRSYDNLVGKIFHSHIGESEEKLGQDRSEMNSLIDIGVNQNTSKIKLEIDDIFEELGLNPPLVDESVIDEELPDERISALVVRYQDKIKKLERESSPSQTKIDQIKRIYLPFPEGTLITPDLYKNFLKNNVKRKQYIMKINHKFKLFQQYYNNYVRIINPKKLDEILEDFLLYGKAEEIADRLFDEFEGRSKGRSLFYEEMQGDASIPTKPFRSKYRRHQPEQKRVEYIGELRESADVNSARANLRLRQYSREAMLNPRNHLFVKKEFFEEATQQSFNQKGFFELAFFELSNLWQEVGVNTPLIATIDGDEHRLAFIGPDGKKYSMTQKEGEQEIEFISPDGKTYHLSIDFDNFQAADMKIRELLGGPYQDDKLFFQIHEAIPILIGKIIDEFNTQVTEGLQQQEDFSDFFGQTLLPQLHLRLPFEIKVDLNPERRKDRDFLKTLDEYIWDILTASEAQQMFIDEQDRTQLFEMAMKITEEIEEATDLVPTDNIYAEVDSIYLRTINSISGNFIDEDSTIPNIKIPLAFFLFDTLVKREHGPRIAATNAGGSERGRGMTRINFTAVGSETQGPVASFQDEFTVNDETGEDIKMNLGRPGFYLRVTNLDGKTQVMDFSSRGDPLYSDIGSLPFVIDMQRLDELKNRKQRYKDMFNQEVAEKVESLITEAYMRNSRVDEALKKIDEESESLKRLKQTSIKHFLTRNMNIITELLRLNADKLEEHSEGVQLLYTKARTYSDVTQAELSKIEIEIDSKNRITLGELLGDQLPIFIKEVTEEMLNKAEESLRSVNQLISQEETASAA